MESADSPVRDNSPPPTPQRTSHNKRRDASYIPRPPNAFILFRSSFIRDQKISNKVEGNHSKLSKIIGMYWKALTKEQRDEWEDKAAQALIEHRKRYPDWRFRHAANLSANVESKIKIKDGARRGRARKDPPDRVGGGAEDTSEEGSGKGRATTRAEEEASRLTKIAGLLSEGQEGEALERAVEEWEAERLMTRRSASVSTQESPSSSPVITRASASADRESTPSTLTFVLSPLSSVSASCSPVVRRAHALSSMDPDLPQAVSESQVLSPSLSASSPVITRASSMGREPSLPYTDTPTPGVSRPPSSPSTPRLSVLTSTSASGSLLNLPPSWPASPVTPQSLASTASRPRPLPWPPSPATPLPPTCSSFSAFSPAERWELEHRLARSKATSSPVLTRASTLTAAEELSTFTTRASSSELTQQALTMNSAATLGPSVSVSASSSHASTMEKDPSAPSHVPILDSSISNAVLSPSSSRTPLASPCTPSRPIPIPAPRWPNSPITPHTASTSAFWPTCPGIPRISTSFPAHTRAEELEASVYANRSNLTQKSALPSPVIARASASTLAAALQHEQSSPSPGYASSTPKDAPSPLSTSSPPVPIPKLPPSWPASPISSASTPAVWPTSPLIPCSASFPAFTRAAEDWELGMQHKSPRLNSASVLSSPIVIHACASASTMDRRTPTPMSSRTPSASSPLKTMTRTPVSISTPSWPASPAPVSALRSPIVARTPVPPSWSNTHPSPVATPRPPISIPTLPNPTPTSESESDPAASATPILSRRSRPRSRSPTQRSPQNANAPYGSTKRSLSAPAPKKRGHQRHSWRRQQQEPVRDAGFWWPAPREQRDCPGREHEPEQEQEEMEMPMQLHVAAPTRHGSFDAFAPQDQDQDAEHDFCFAGKEGGERVWSWSDFGYDMKSASGCSSIPSSDQAPTAAPAHHLRFHTEPSPTHERWFNPWDADSVIHAGEFLHPLPPTPISPISPPSPAPFAFSPIAHNQCSSFSSLAGWDGSSSEHANANSDADHGASAGTCAAVKASVAGIDGMGWGRGGLQRLGVQGGGYRD
ncbi:hypothetical protein C0993_000972 [Termitomyces sp. T159_Od127]|nr:hypothetical protein C0993_000972 [Termitomyces sp. T159_Od127]